ncbi:MAG: biopolymer transporter ExbD [Myxococcota bacterium]|jgi:hypothetical protein|nr:biopolymer transporter ExbD [Myxococcota bacterium]
MAEEESQQPEPRKRERRKPLTQELNLIPIMNLVSILIPFLLMAAEFVHLAVIDSTLPAIGAPTPPEEQEEPDKPPLNLSLGITNRGIYVMGADAVLNPDGPPPVTEGEDRPPTVACRSGDSCAGVDDYDWKKLTKILSEIKDEYPDDENVILVPDSNVHYEILVRTMDHSREDREKKDSEGKYTVLFPFVVLAGGQ